MSQPKVETASALNALLRCSTITAILLQCCAKVRLASSVTPNTFGFFSISSTWSANYTCGCMWCSRLSGVKSATANLAVDTQFVIVDVVKHMRQIYVEDID